MLSEIYVLGFGFGTWDVWDIGFGQVCYKDVSKPDHKADQVKVQQAVSPRFRVATATKQPVMEEQCNKK